MASRTKKVNFETLKSAIVDGKCIAELKQQVFFRRTINKRTSVHFGIILENVNNLIVIYDETIGQQYTIDLSESIPDIRIS